MTDVELSDEALLVMGGTFGWGAVLTYGMAENVPSPEISKALNELIDAGLILQEINSDDMPRGALRYRVHPLVSDRLPHFRKVAAEMIDSRIYPAIRMFVKRDDPSPTRADALEGRP